MRQWIKECRAEIYTMIFGVLLFTWAGIDGGNSFLIAFLHSSSLMSCAYGLACLMGWWGVEMINITNIDSRIKREYPEFKSKYLWKESL